MASKEHRQQGKVSQWNDKKGFGYITHDDSGARLFFHISDFSSQEARPRKGARVTFFTRPDQSAKPRATNVQFSHHQRIRQALVPGSKSFPVGLLLTMLLTILTSLYLARVLSLVTTGIYVVMSVITYTAYAIDKRAAQRNQWRIKERNLHMLSVAGGWPGAMLARYHLRHKSRKQPFRVIFWGTLVVNLGLVYLITNQMPAF
ncbi:DUF1294 domain-containing protein [Salinimonas lutimaris]|uniref:DUF1294 domain-containing protein n=1 Tax=Salinimonas lutimaris TaxID=914153 RepID=UPI0010C12ABD|nr:cold shock and DUF1294 domain-containing protein [Salinimonas lutimaris]